MSEIPLGLGIVSTIISALSIAFAICRTSRADTKDLENRLTMLEGNQITPLERSCIHDTEVKMNLFWSIVEREFPRLLKQDVTPELDELLDKAEKKALTDEDRATLIKMLESEYSIALAAENSRRAMALALYKAMISFSSKVLLDPKICLPSV